MFGRKISNRRQNHMKHCSKAEVYAHKSFILKIPFELMHLTNKAE